MYSKSIKCHSIPEELYSICEKEKVEKIEICTQERWICQTIAFVPDPNGYQLYTVVPAKYDRIISRCRVFSPGGEKLVAAEYNRYLPGFWKPFIDEAILDKREKDRRKTDEECSRRRLLRRERKQLIRLLILYFVMAPLFVFIIYILLTYTYWVIFLTAIVALIFYIRVLYFT